jgi:hypothetical protein
MTLSGGAKSQGLLTHVVSRTDRGQRKVLLADLRFRMICIHPCLNCIMVMDVTSQYISSQSHT